MASEAKEPKSNKAESGETTEKLTVALRIRPLKQEEHAKEVRIAHAVDNKMVVLVDPLDDRFGVLHQKRPMERRYVFDLAFDGEDAQQEVYKRTTQPLVDSVMSGFNATVFAYGATGTGKTYTMVGNDKEPGIMVRTLNELFRRVEETSDDLSFKVTMSYLEIYNEMIRDLLNPSSGYLELREDTKKVQVVGLTEVSTNSTSEVIKLLTKGNRARTIESTSANQTSSRSHALLEVCVRQQSRIKKGLEEVRVGKLYMIDLAGSERASNTQNRGKRLVEGAHINRSLLALGNCINALADKGSKYVNYRDSKLTRLLKDALSGNCKTVMIAHISPAASHFDESRNTLVYADRAKNIRNKIRRNVVDVTYHVAQYQTIIDELRHEIDRLKTKMDSPPSSAGQTEKLSTSQRRHSPEEMSKLKEDLIKIFNEQMDLRRQLMEIDTHVLSLSIEFEKQSMVVGEWEAERNKKMVSRDGRRLGKDIEDLSSEPPHVRQAWDDLMFIQDEQQRYWDVRKDVERQFRDCQSRASKIEEELPFRISGNDQKELLSLLCKVHELEIEKMEMQAETLLKEHELRRKDMMLLRYGRQRNLCNEIIQRQKVIIDSIANGNADNKVTCPPELQELYDQYQLELNSISPRELETAKSSTSKPLFPELDHGPVGPARQTRSIAKKLPKLPEENRMFVRRGTLSDSGSSTQSRHTPPSRSSLNGASVPHSGSPALLPPIEGKPSEHVMKDSLRNINAVAARRRSVRTADRRNIETWYNSRMAKPRGSSVLNGFSNDAVTATTNPVLHRRRPLLSSGNRSSPSVSKSRVPIYADYGRAYPKRVLYFPPNQMLPMTYPSTDVSNSPIEFLDNLDHLTLDPSSPLYRGSRVEESVRVMTPSSEHHVSLFPAPRTPMVTPTEQSRHLHSMTEASS